jgi:DNA primase small subunit
MPELTLRDYYQSKYPYKQLVALLTSNGDKLEDCEFAIEGKATEGDKIYKRYVRATSADDLRRQVHTFTGVRAFHFGAFYDHGVNRELIRAGESRATRRVLSFDIDLTDKEFLTTTDADGTVSAKLCDKAYPVSAMSAYILRVLLNEAFGFQRVLIVYSGRRGVHVHVFDEAAMLLNDEQRAAVLAYVDGSMHENKLHVRPEVRSVMVVHNLRGEVYRCFEGLVTKLGILDLYGNRADFVNRLNLLQREEHEKLGPVLATLGEDVLEPETGLEAWKLIQDKFKSVVFMGPDWEWVEARLDCVVLTYVWPRLDENVTKDTKHLIKVPFSCHAASGRVASAISRDRRPLFNYKPQRDAPSIRDWDDAQMAEAVELFAAPGAPPEDVDMEDAAGPSKRPSRVLGWMPRRATAPRKKQRSPLVPSWAVDTENHEPVPEERMSERERKAKLAEELHAEEVEQQTDAILRRVQDADAKRRVECYVGMPLASAGQVLPGYKEAAWAAHGMAPPALPQPYHRRDVYGNVITV